MLIALAAVLSRAAIRANDRATPKTGWILGTTVALATATAPAFWLLAGGHLPAPRLHAMGATLNGLAAYVFVHAAIGPAILASNTLRTAGGWTSPKRGTDFLLTRIWLDYTAATAAISLGLAALVV